MEILKGKTIETIGNLIYQGDFLYHEGPLLSHFISNEDTNKHYIYKWSDNNDTHNRWLVFEVTSQDLLSFFRKENSWLSLIQKQLFVFFVDENSEAPFDKTITQCFSKDIPEDYLPSENSIFKDNKYESYAYQLKDKLESITSLPEKTEIKDDIVSRLIEEICSLKAQQADLKAQQADLNIILNQLASIISRLIPFEKTINFANQVDMLDSFSSKKHININDLDAKQYSKSFSGFSITQTPFN